MPIATIRSVIGAWIVLIFSICTVAADPPSLQKASGYTGNEAVAGWLMSEKLDGIRGYWNGERLLTRQGKTIHAPAWFTGPFPPFALDGELWRRRNDFAFVQNTVLDRVPAEGWREITYNIFEVPAVPGDFPSRLAKARAWFEVHPAPHVRIIEQQVCRGREHLDRFLATVEALGGEGVIVKDPAPEFHAGRSPDVLKVKRFSDMEGTVIAHNPGKGRFSGMLGSLALQLESGVVFNLGSGFTLRQRQHPPPVGAVVTFKFQGFTQNGIPRFASFLRVRKD
ncbi:ATP-dependent DNA ligase [Desulfosarcina ovata subsp. sediminis]|uniref:ATP-dependent DNA ligase n=1 Tax=Desulfosarcina ovata subsp. sediminis TaxID=885957 RepID=A0A5K7ZWD6_9BACT|nr:DNA ligase [Desulfosarcina ovata]BBO84569.1 ATP-dependent DNA ligase [Desulfosarcina ovata subsp. sediminis]